jgi:ribokinase
MTIISFGSINMDLVARTPRFANPGETLTGRDFYTAAGGKGANQAVAAAKLFGKSIMIGCVGNDIFGKELKENLEANGVDTRAVGIKEDLPTGTALITVDDAAENTIIIIPGANGAVGERELAALDRYFANAKVLMLQLEVPLETIISAAKKAKEFEVKVVLDPAPARELPDELLNLCDFITPNETEAQILTGVEIHDMQDAKEAARLLREHGVRSVIIKMSSKGSYYYDGDHEIVSPAFKVDPVDTVAAGDAFNGGFAAAYAAGKPLDEVLQWANGAGALSTTKAGAQPSMPTKEELLDFIAQQPNHPDLSN